jgi:hypothetical protein
VCVYKRTKNKRTKNKKYMQEAWQCCTVALHLAAQLNSTRPIGKGVVEDVVEDVIGGGGGGGQVETLENSSLSLFFFNLGKVLSDQKEHKGAVEQWRQRFYIYEYEYMCVCVCIYFYIYMNI